VTASAARAPKAERSDGLRALAVAATLLPFVAALIAVAALVGLGGASFGSLPSPIGDEPSALAAREIPAAYLRLYQEAGAKYGLNWAVLAGIGKVECDHGRDPDPSCTREGAVNSAGAGGPMQFLAQTWARYGVDGDGNGTIDRWSPADAIFSAANYLRASGAPRDYEAALYAYNHASWYVTEVEDWAKRYESVSRNMPVSEGEAGFEGADLKLQRESATRVQFVRGERAILSPSDGHVAYVPAGVPAVVQAMVVAGNELQNLRHGPGGHPDPRGSLEEDCSSTVNYVLYRSGVRSIGEIVRDNPLAQNYITWGLPGPGRWVTIYATTRPTDHVFIIISGLRLDTSHTGTDIGPNQGEDGPRWRILDHVPGWAHWSVRHPSGL
jgi:hypothetical protein